MNMVFFCSQPYKYRTLRVISSIYPHFAQECLLGIYQQVNGASTKQRNTEGTAQLADRFVTM